MSTTTPDLESLRKFRDFGPTWDTSDRHEMRPQADVLEFTPFHEDRVLLKRLEPLADMGRSFMLSYAQQRAHVGIQRGLVIACAAGVDEVRPGDVVLYSRQPTNEFEHDGDLYCFVYEEQSILGVDESWILQKAAEEDGALVLAGSISVTQ